MTLHGNGHIPIRPPGPVANRSRASPARPETPAQTRVRHHHLLAAGGLSPGKQNRGGLYFVILGAIAKNNKPFVPSESSTNPSLTCRHPVHVDPAQEQPRDWLSQASGHLPDSHGAVPMVNADFALDPCRPNIYRGASQRTRPGRRRHQIALLYGTSLIATIPGIACMRDLLLSTSVESDYLTDCPKPGSYECLCFPHAACTESPLMACRGHYPIYTSACSRFRVMRTAFVGWPIAKIKKHPRRHVCVSARRKWAVVPAAGKATRTPAKRKQVSCGFSLLAPQSSINSIMTVPCFSPASAIVLSRLAMRSWPWGICFSSNTMPSLPSSGSALSHS
jgi:hypothetical protein